MIYYVDSIAVYYYMYLASYVRIYIHTRATLGYADHPEDERNFPLSLALTNQPLVLWRFIIITGFDLAKCAFHI